jgi:hypothetical protein
MDIINAASSRKTLDNFCGGVSLRTVLGSKGRDMVEMAVAPGAARHRSAHCRAAVRCVRSARRAGVADAPGRPARWRGEVRPRAWI